jgi:hypothetical protein
LVFDVPVTNDYGTINVKGNGSITDGGQEIAQRFTLIHNTIITPFFLAGQQTDLENNIAPSYLKAAKSLKYITSIDVGRTSNDPNFIQTVGFSALDGNVGFYDENFNGNNNNFSIESVTYKNQALETITSAELTDNVQTVEIVVKDDRPTGVFSNNDTEFDLTFFILPDDVSEYRNNNKTILQNFYLDKAFNTVGALAVDGDNATTNYQVFKNVTATFDNINQITINAEIDFTSTAVTELTDKGFDYFIGVSVQDHLKDTEDSDRVHLKADVKPFYIDLSDDGMITIDNPVFLRHFESDPTTEGTTTPIVRTEDDVLTYGTFYIDRNTRETDNIALNALKTQLVAKKTDGSEFILEEYEQSFNGTLVVNDSQFIDVSQERSFKMPSGDPRKTIKVKRRIDLDTTDLRYYEFYYPFLMRWEYWKTLSQVNSDAFDTNEPNNGYNNEWQRYDTLTDWDIYFRVEVRATKNAESLVYRKDVQLETYDYLEGTDWINEQIESLNNDTLASQGTILIDPTRIKVTKEYTGASVPATADDVEWVIRMEVYEQGGITEIRYISSVYDWL